MAPCFCLYLRGRSEAESCRPAVLATLLAQESMEILSRFNATTKIKVAFGGASSRRNHSTTIAVSYITHSLLS
jgi:hypothetical protein